MHINGKNSSESASKTAQVIVIMLLTACLMTSVFGAGEGKMNPVKSEGFANINGTELYYRIIGHGEPIVFLHGGPGLFHDYFLPHVEPLASDFQLIFYDQRASGRSSGKVPADSVNIENFVRDLDGIREFLDLEKISILGHSWGGLLALYYTLAHPDRVKNLILVDSAPPNSALDAVNFAAREKRRTVEDREAIQEIMGSEAFQKLESSAVMKYFQVSEKVKFYDPAMMEKMRMELDREKIEKLMLVGQLMNPWLEDYDISEKLSAMSCPTLIIHGDYDTIPLESAEILHQRISGSKLAVFRNCGHFPFIEAPGPFLREVASFMDENKGL
jgi:proline iminopeptidase